MDCWQWKYHLEDCSGGMNREEKLQQRSWRELDFLFDDCAEVLCFVCGDDYGSLFHLESVTRGCAEGPWGGQCAADGGNDGFGGCKAHGCDLLVKRGSSGQPSLCFRDGVVCCHSSGSEL